jgi:hypothetical protein
MRAIARHTGASITGINNNAYQLARLEMHNIKGGLQGQCDAVKVCQKIDDAFKNCTIIVVF